MPLANRHCELYPSRRQKEMRTRSLVRKVGGNHGQQASCSRSVSGRQAQQAATRVHGESWSAMRADIKNALKLALRMMERSQHWTLRDMYWRLKLGISGLHLTDLNVTHSCHLSLCHS